VPASGKPNLEYRGPSSFTREGLGEKGEQLRLLPFL